MMLYMTFLDDVLRNHHNILLFMTIHSLGDLSMTVCLVTVTVERHQLFWQLSDLSMMDSFCHRLFWQLSGLSMMDGN